jgi:hypothetical protein
MIDPVIAGLTQFEYHNTSTDGTKNKRRHNSARQPRQRAGARCSLGLAARAMGSAHSHPYLGSASAPVAAGGGRCARMGRPSFRPARPPRRRAALVRARAARSRGRCGARVWPGCALGSAGAPVTAAGGRWRWRGTNSAGARPGGALARGTRSCGTPGSPRRRPRARARVASSSFFTACAPTTVELPPPPEGGRQGHRPKEAARVVRARRARPSAAQLKRLVSRPREYHNVRCQRTCAKVQRHCAQVQLLGAVLH